MRRRLSLILVLLAWLFATGSQWQVVQSFAWTRMILSYAKTMPLDQAIRLTFTPDNMCGVCELVSAAQHEHPGDTALPPGTSLDSKPLLVFQPAPTVIFTAPATGSWSLSDHLIPATERAAPPLPPPRARTA